MAMEAIGPIRAKYAPLGVGQRVALELRDQIAEGRFRPGERLNEVALSEAFGVSRNTLREAFTELVSERLIVRTPNKGAFVATFTEADAHDIFVLRRVIEGGAIRTGPCVEAIDRIGTAIAQASQARSVGDVQGIGTANNRFHRAIVELAGSERLNMVMDQTLAEMRLIFLAAPSDVHLAWVDANKNIYGALRDGKRDQAGLLMDEYLTSSEASVLSYMRRD